MRALLQRVSSASVTVDGQVTGACGLGFLILLGVGPDDGEQQVIRLWDKIKKLRVFDDGDGKMKYLRNESSQSKYFEKSNSEILANVRCKCSSFGAFILNSTMS